MLKRAAATSRFLQPKFQSQFHSCAIRLQAASTVSKPVQKSPYSYHWNADRALSIATPLVMGTAFVYGYPMVDAAMGIVLPLHIHMGFGQMIEDYVPKRKFGILYDFCVWLLRLVTGVVLYGCYVINSKDVGLTRLTKQLWTGKKE